MTNNKSLKSTTKKTKITWEELNKALNKIGIIESDRAIREITLIRPKQLLIYTVEKESTPASE